MTTMTDYWERVEDAMTDARLVAWDTCHKIYLALDDTEAAWFRENYLVVEDTPEAMLETVRRWYDGSCFLRFVTGVRHNAADPNAGYVTLIPQGAEEEDEHDDYCDCDDCGWERGEDDEE